MSLLQDIPTGADSCVTSLSCDPQRSLVAAGLGDGSVRVYDRRMGPNEWCVSFHRALIVEPLPYQTEHLSFITESLTII